MAKECFNINTRRWERRKAITNQDVEDIVGKVGIRVDSLGNIEIDKTLTASEKALIEAL